MKLKLWIAGAIVAIIAVCAVAVAATSQSVQEQDESQQAVPSASYDHGQAADNREDGTPDSPVIAAAAASMPSASLESAGQQQTAQSVISVSGRIIEGRGSGLSDKPVTLHLMGYHYSGDQVTGTWEVYNLTTTTSGEGANTGRFVFDNVIVTPDTQCYYVSSYTTLPNGMTIYGYSNNFTLKDNTSIGFIVLADPDDFDPYPI